MSDNYKQLPALLLISPGPTIKAVVARARTETNGQVSGAPGELDSKELLEPSAADDRLVLWDLGASGLPSALRPKITRLARSFPLVLASDSVTPALEQAAAEIGAVDVVSHAELSPALLRTLLRHVTARRSAERQLQRLALMDQTTGLASQILFWEMLGQAVLRARRAKDFFSVMLIDFDWSVVPPEVREQTLPALFATAARRTRELMRGTDTVARFDKAQIAVLAVSMPRVEDVQIVAERLVGDLGETIEHDGATYQGKFGIGIALFPTSATDPENLVSRASHALAAAREHGGNSYAFA
jgi:diguanylate cyclase (GGDEF)-like protein